MQVALALYPKFTERFPNEALAEHPTMLARLLG
jgi:hypothetical protein